MLEKILAILIVTLMVMVGSVLTFGAHHNGERHSASHYIYHEVPGAKFTLETHGYGSPSGGLGNPPFPRFTPERFRGVRPLKAIARPPVRPHDATRRPQQPQPKPSPPKLQRPASEEKQLFANEGASGCITSEGFYFAGQTWYVKGCRRRTCIHFRGSFITETDSCDTEIFNPTYKCIVQVDTNADYPDCCPTYHCNPDNLGNSVK